MVAHRESGGREGELIGSEGPKFIFAVSCMLS